MMLGIEPIGVMEIGVDTGRTPNLLIEGRILPLEIAAQDVRQVILYSIDLPLLEITDAATHNVAKVNVESLTIEIDVAEEFNRVFGYVAEDVELVVTGVTTLGKLMYVLDPAVLEIFTDISGGASLNIQQFSTSTLVLGSVGIHRLYSDLVQEFIDDPVELGLGGTSGETYVVAGGGGGPTEIPQIWIG